MRAIALQIAVLALHGAAMPPAVAQAPQPKHQIQQDMKAVRPDAAKTIRPGTLADVIIYKVIGDRNAPSPGATLTQAPIACRELAADGKIT